MSNKVLNQLNILLASILTLLGFSNCDSISPWSDVCEYGTPYSKYEIKGAVLNTEDEALKDIRVTTKEIIIRDAMEFCIPTDTIYTNADGKYILKGDSYRAEEKIMRVIVEDPKDIYATDSMDVVMQHTNKGKDNWCNGTDTGKADFILKKKDSNEQK